jgi:hypothetical protein
MVANKFLAPNLPVCVVGALVCGLSAMHPHAVGWVVWLVPRW